MVISEMRNTISFFLFIFISTQSVLVSHVDFESPPFYSYAFSGYAYILVNGSLLGDDVYVEGVFNRVAKFTFEDGNVSTYIICRDPLETPDLPAVKAVGNKVLFETYCVTRIPTVYRVEGNVSMDYVVDTGLYRVDVYLNLSRVYYEVGIYGEELLEESKLNISRIVRQNLLEDNISMSFSLYVDEFNRVVDVEGDVLNPGINQFYLLYPSDGEEYARVSDEGYSYFLLGNISLALDLVNEQYICLYAVYEAERLISEYVKDAYVDQIVRASLPMYNGLDIQSFLINEVNGSGSVDEFVEYITSVEPDSYVDSRLRNVLNVSVDAGRVVIYSASSYTALPCFKAIYPLHPSITVDEKFILLPMDEDGAVLAIRLTGIDYPSGFDPLNIQVAYISNPLAHQIISLLLSPVAIPLLAILAIAIILLVRMWRR